MSVEKILDRRRLRRRATGWRLAAFLFLALAALAFLHATTGLSPDGPRRPQVARVSVDGFIGIRPAAVRIIEKAADAKAVRAIMLRINSPGGAASGGEALYNAVRSASEKKPVVAVIEGIGTSGAYMTAIAADHIVARESAITGSIGVIFQFPHFDELLEKVGVAVEEVKSAPLKAEPNMYGKPDPAAIEMMQAVVDDTYAWFTGLVAERRSLSPVEARRLADGRIYTGRQALDVKLVDQVGGEREARAWLTNEKAIDEALPAIDWRDPDASFWPVKASVVRLLGGLLGIDPSTIPFSESALPGRLLVDGLLMVWHAP